MNLKIFTVGSFFTNCYLVWCDESRDATVIDPGFERQEESNKVLAILKRNDLRVKFIINTHGHPDHTCGNGIIKRVTGAPILIHEFDAHLLNEANPPSAELIEFRSIPPTADRFLDEDHTIKFGKVVLRVLYTPGHSPGSISLVGEECVFTGDTLFAGSIGRVDLLGGSGAKMMLSLREKLMTLPDDYIIYPGHGPKSTIGDEKRSNPFLQRNFDFSFLG
ncbi:MAG: MBL fold metallo-hydrolase [Candidatus Bathyarchaeota archaeon]|nr:MAG: MBL fold metallo-hydrolase [Candidatus Bathyarchaeota archaeon]